MNSQEAPRSRPVRPVKPQARFGVFSPSDPIYPRRVPFLEQGLKILESWGYQVPPLNPELLSVWSTLRKPSERVDEIHALITDPTIDVLIAAWGGKNTNELLELLDYDLIGQNNKPIIGSSDVAVLLNAIAARAGIVSFYGPNVLGKLNQTSEVGLPLLVSKSPKTEIQLDSPAGPVVVIRDGEAHGRLVGGSLGTFTLGLAGTRFMPQYKHTIFFLESASLSLFQVRQHLYHLKLTGFTSSVAGVLVGAMTNLEADVSELDAFLRFFFGERIPILRCSAFGHGDFPNPTIPIGPIAQLNTADGILRVIEEVIE